MIKKIMMGVALFCVMLATSAQAATFHWAFDRSKVDWFTEAGLDIQHVTFYVVFVKPHTGYIFDTDYTGVYKAVRDGTLDSFVNDPSGVGSDYIVKYDTATLNSSAVKDADGILPPFVYGNEIIFNTTDLKYDVLFVSIDNTPGKDPMKDVVWYIAGPTPIQADGLSNTLEIRPQGGMTNLTPVPVPEPAAGALALAGLALLFRRRRE